MLLLLLLLVIISLSLAITNSGISNIYNNAYNNVNKVLNMNGGGKKASDSSNTNKAIKDLTFNVKKDINRIIRGTKCLYDDSMEALKLKAIQKKNGLKSFTYSQYKFLEQANDDFGKILKLGLTLSFAPEFFFYSYIVFPMMTPTNPWAWRALPSGYDDDNDIIKRDAVISRRRLQALVNSVSALKGETVEDQPSEVMQQKQKHVEIVEKVLKSKNDDEALDYIRPWLLTTKKDTKDLKLNLGLLPPIVVKECLKSFGLEGLPNIPLIRRFNAGELSKHIKKIKKEDEFLYSKGVNSLEEDEVELACRDRCINVDRNDNKLRKDLQEYLNRSCKKDTTIFINSIKGKSLSPLVINENNRVMALLTINVVKDFKQSDFATTYKLLN